MPFSTSGPRAKMSSIPGGDAGTTATLKIMRKVVIEALTDEVEGPALRQKAMQIIRRCRTKDHVCEAKTLFDWVKKNMRWTRDIYNIETIQRPLRTIQMGGADCDDLSILLATLWLSVGLGPVRFKAIAADASKRDQFSHVFVQLEINGKWVSADPSVPKAAFGWEAPRSFRTKTLLI